MARFAAWLALVIGACTPAQSPAARGVGKVMAVGGVVGLAASAAASGVAETRELVTGFSVISAVGIITYAVGELSDPPKGRAPETEQHKLRRWARILTGRASGAAREGNCPRVRRLERRVNLYDREVHDFVFMRDPEIVRCLEGEAAPPAPAPVPTPAVAPAPD